MKADTSAQYGALQESCGLWLSSASARLVLAGEDRVRFLDGLVTCEIKHLEPGRGVHGFFTDVKGHVLADVVVWASSDRLLLEVPATCRDSIATHIDKYVVVDRVAVRVADDQTALSLAGPQTVANLERLLEAPPTATWSHANCRVLAHDAWISVDPRAGVPTWTVWSNPAATAELRANLVAGGVLEADPEAREALRLETGMPVFGIDYGSDNLPQETGLEDSISYTKGCYLGQEVVARLHYRGQVARRLARLQSIAGEAPSSGTVLLLEGRPAGTVTSTARSPTAGSVIVLAMLQRRALEPGTQLQMEREGSVVRVVD